MPTPITVSAPGKLFLLGEYAVLDGAPALLTAVDRRARVTLAPADTTHWHFHAPNLGLDDIRLGPHGTLPHDLDRATHTRLAVFDAVRATVAEQLETPLDPLQVHIDTTDFARDGYKLGLGSSAAVAVALTHALARAAGLRRSPAQLTALAVCAHRRAQNGRGSGGDVAAAACGGLISYRREHQPLVLQWPASLAGMAVVTGAGASTPDLVDRVQSYAERDPHGYAGDIGRLSRLADGAADALDPPEHFLHLAREYFGALRTLDHHARAGIVTPRHDALHALARRYNAVFKTSGAGGGDVGLVFVRQGPDEHNLHIAFEEAGAHILPIGFGASGARVENNANAATLGSTRTTHTIK